MGRRHCSYQRVDGPEHMYSQHFACPDCHISLPKIEPRMFSFNSPFGACPACLGIGSTMEVDEERVIQMDLLPLLMVVYKR